MEPDLKINARGTENAALALSKNVAPPESNLVWRYPCVGSRHNNATGMYVIQFGLVIHPISVAADEVLPSLSGFTYWKQCT